MLNNNNNKKKNNIINISQKQLYNHDSKKARTLCK